jgi:hypothetical protein
MSALTAKLKRRQQISLIDKDGSATVIDGKSTKAIWETAQPSRVQMFLTDEEWARGVYLAHLYPDATCAPIAVKNGSSAVRTTLGWKTVIRDLYPDEEADIVISWTAVCVLVAA